MDTNMLRPMNKTPAILFYEDRLSSLPDDIITRILSLLPTKAGVRTSVLSRQWRHKWIYIYNIDVDDSDFGGTTSEKDIFIGYVQKMLLLRPRRLKCFRLVYQTKRDSYCEISSYYLALWISYALSQQVQDLMIVDGSAHVDHSGWRRERQTKDFLYNRIRTVLPRCLSNCYSLTKLFLDFKCTLTVSADNRFAAANLKYLYLHNVEISNDQQYPTNTGELLLDFPVLESLELKCVRFLNVKSVEIRAPSLIKFSCFVICEVCMYGLELPISLSPLGKNVVLNAPSVRESALDSHNFFGSQNLAQEAYAILRRVRGLECLTLSGYIVHVLVESGLGLTLPKFCHLRELVLTSHCQAEVWLQLLEVMPYLESLRMCMYTLLVGYEYGQAEPVPSCIMSHLKKVVFRWFHYAVHTVKFFVKNAKKLERITVLICSSTTSDAEIKVRNELLALIPKDSNCKIDVERVDIQY